MLIALVQYSNYVASISWRIRLLLNQGESTGSKRLHKSICGYV